MALLRSGVAGAERACMRVKKFGAFGACKDRLLAGYDRRNPDLGQGCVKLLPLSVASDQDGDVAGGKRLVWPLLYGEHDRRIRAQK